MPSLLQRSETGISLRNPSNTILILSSAVNFRRVFALTSLISLAALPGVVVTSSLSNIWVVASMVFFLSDGSHYSRLFHPDQHSTLQTKIYLICPLFAEDQQHGGDNKMNSIEWKEALKEASKEMCKTLDAFGDAVLFLVEI